MADWQEPGAHEVADGIFRVPLPLPMDGLRAVNVYAVTHGSAVTMIDAGWAVEESRTQLEQSLKRIDLGLADVDRFLVTHVHRDHYTQAVAVRKEFGTRVSLGIGEKGTIDILNDGRPDGPAQLGLLRRFGAAEMVAELTAAWSGQTDPSVWEPPTDWIEDGQELPVGDRSLLAVHTPGHTRGHLVFADLAHGLLFAGDHVLPHITPSIGFEAAVAASPLADYLRSLAAVRAMPDLRLLPAHGPVTESVHARVDELLAHHEDRLAASLAAVEAGAVTPYEVAKALGWTRRNRSFADLDAGNRMLAVCETAAHLLVLVAQDRARRSTVDGVDHFAA
ncbi:MAG TPA: MBL fold metallo-hydrolase [Mycobacteriales bacterium]|nr:MBL fold metallo-hydrolase [Mycobacteriales bacterium]